VLGKAELGEKLKLKSSPKILIMLISVFFLTFFWHMHNGLRMGDSAIFAQALSKNNGIKLESEYLSSMTKFLFSIYGSPSFVSLDSLPTNIEEFPIMRNHSYLILYLLKPFSIIFPFSVLDALIASIIFIGPPFLIYQIFRIFKPQHKISNLFLIYFISILLLFPGNIWAAKGQFYPDKLSIIFLPLLIVSNEIAKKQNRSNFKNYYVLVFLGALITERSAIYVALISIIYGLTRLLKIRKSDKIVLVYLTTGTLLVAYAAIYIGIFTRNHYSDSYLIQILNYRPSFAKLLSDGSVSLLIVILPIVVLIRKEFDLLAILLIGTLPYLMGTMGGAEKYGWMTHYLSYLTGLVIGVVAASLIRTFTQIDYKLKKLSKKIKSKESKQINPSTNLLIAFMISFISFLTINPYSPTPNLSIINKERLGTSGSIVRWYADPNYRSEIYLKERSINKIISQIPTDASVTVTEITAPWLAQRNKRIYQLPLGIKTSEFLLLESNDFSGEFSSPIVPLPLSPANSITLTNEITNYTLSNCFELKAYDKAINTFLFKRAVNSC
jgi:hypothetical protein